MHYPVNLLNLAYLIKAWVIHDIALLRVRSTRLPSLRFKCMATLLSIYEACMYLYMYLHPKKGSNNPKC